MFRHIFVLVTLTLSLMACVTISNPLRPGDIREFKLVDISVTAAPGAVTTWPEIDGEEPAASSTQAEAQKTRAPVAVVERDRLLSERLRERFAQRIGPQLRGERPVRAIVTIVAFEILSKSQRTVSGGHHRLKADVVLADARSGQELLAYRDQKATQFAGGGAAAVVGGLVGGGIGGMVGGLVANAAAEARTINAEVLIDSYLDDYAKWLLAS